MALDTSSRVDLHFADSGLAESGESRAASQPKPGKRWRMHGQGERDAAAHPRQAAQPVFIDGMFGWLHRPQPDWGGEVAVLICPALSRDALDSHRFLRVLGDEFAAAGYPALRFDYPGTGDSCDLAAAGNAWLGWRQGVRAAADYVLAETGAKRLILCGLRIGATLAALEAEARDEVSGLILLAPVVRGQSYCRQLSVQARLQHNDGSRNQPGFTFEELSFTQEAVQSINQADLRAVKMPGRAIAICAQSPSAPLAACERAWGLQGATLWSTDFSGLEPLLSHPLEGDIPPADFSKILHWARQNIPPCPVFRPARPAGAVRRSGDGLVETAISFGPHGGLFGMLCQPENAPADIVVILCAAGRNPRYGAGRSTVQLARQLAAAGIASLRMDFAGLGDSAGPLGRERMISRIFEARGPDISAAVDRLAALGYRRFALQGLCSGAFHAFHAALGDPRIGMLLLVNMPIFEESDAAVAPVAIRAALPWFYYLFRLAHKHAWARLLGGHTNFGAILRGQLSRIRAAARWPWRGGGKPRPSFARSAIARLSQRGVETLFLFGVDEAGFYVVKDNFGPNGRDLSQLDHVAVEFIGKFDHVMSLPETQNAAIGAMLGKLLAWRRTPET